MSTADSQFDPTSSEEIVAYLDGELPPDQAGRVEARLVADPHFREQLQQLDQAWSALDELPPAAVDDTFAKTTIEMVALAAEKDVADQTRELPIQRRKRTRKLAIVGLCTAVAGFALAAALLPDANRRLIDNLPVILEIDVFTQIDDVDYLRAVERAFDAEHHSLVPNDMDVDRSDYQTLSAAPADQRRAWIERLPAYEKELLSVNARRFDGLPPAERQRIQDLHDEILNASDSASLQATLVAYGEWLADRTPGQQAQIGDRNIAAKDRLDLIRESLRREFRSLSDPEEEAFRQVLWDFARERFERDQRPDRPGPPPGPERSAWDFARNMTRGYFRGSRDDEALGRLLAPLDDETRDYFAALSPRRKQEQLRRWILESLRRPRDRDINPQDLERVFSDNLTNDEREKLLSMPREDMRQQLEQRARGDDRGGPPFDRWFDFDRRRRGDGDRDRRRDNDDDPYRDRPPQRIRKGELVPPWILAGLAFSPAASILRSIPPLRFGGQLSFVFRRYVASRSSLASDLPLALHWRGYRSSNRVCFNARSYSRI